MKYMLDTNICIYVLKEKPPHVIDKFKSLQPSDIILSSITVAELRYGASYSQHPIKSHNVIDIFTDTLTIESFYNDAASQYGKLFAHLRKQGKPIGPMDALIAAHALALKTTLVTNNTKEFERVPNIHLANWA